MTRKAPPIPQPRASYPDLSPFWKKLKRKGDPVFVDADMPLPRIQSNAHNYGRRHGFKVITRKDEDGMWVWRVS